MNKQFLSSEERLDQFNVQIKSALDDTWHKYTIHNRLDITLIGLTLILSAAITILGFLGKGTIAGIFGVILTTLLSTQKVFNLSDKAEFYRRTHMSIKEIRDRLKYKVNSESDMQSLVDAFMAIRENRRDTNPRRKSWEDLETVNAVPKAKDSKSI